MAILKDLIVQGATRLIGDATAAKFSATSIYENGVALSSKYLGISAKAADADKLDGNDSSYFAVKKASVGSATNPIYTDSNGVFQACTYSLNKTVPADAVFTDHTYNFSGTTFYSGNGSNAEHNADNAVKNGNYYYSSNGPATSLGASTGDGALYVQSYSDAWVGQIAQDYRNGRLFVRGKNNGTWQSWARIAQTGEAQPASDVYAWAKASTKPSYTASEVGALKNYGNDASRPNGTSFTMPEGANPVSMRSGAASGADIGIFRLSDDNAFVCNSSDNSYLFAAFDTDKTANFSTADNAAFAVLSDHAGVSMKGNLAVAGSITSGGTAVVLTDDSRLSDARPASDVYAWAKASTKPSYTASEVGAQNLFRYGTQSSTTKIKIKINSTSSWMLCFTVTLYQAYRATKVMVSGYQYGSSYWYQPEACILGDSDGTETISVYFGYDSANNLWVGFDGASYTGVSINDVTNGYTQLTNFDGLFTITNESSLTTIQKTVTAESKANYANSAGSCTGNAATATDADKLDGQHGSYYQVKVSALGSSTQPVYISAAGTFSTCDLSTTYAPYNSDGYLPLTGGVLNNGTSDTPLYIKAGVSSANGAYIGFLKNNGTNLGYIGVDGNGPVFYKSSGSKIWHEGNDGSGSGLDADKLDGQEGSYYATASDVSTLQGYFSSGILKLANGGTGSSTAAGARANLGTWALVSDSYNTLMPADGTTNGWVKIGTSNTSYGLLPSTSGGAGSGHNYLGTSSWYWKYAYVDQIYGYLNGNISGNAATATSAETMSSFAQGSGGTDRYVWFSWNGNLAKPAYSSDLLINLTSRTLKTVNFTASGTLAASGAATLSSTLNVAGATTISNTLNVSSTITASGNIQSHQGVAAYGIADLSVGGAGMGGTVTSITAGTGLTGGTITSSGTIALGIASSSALGGIKVGSGLSITSAGVLSATYSYTLPLAANGTRGGIQLGFATSAANRNYAVQVSSEKAYVNVPWVEVTTNTVAGWGYKKGMVYTTSTASSSSIDVATGADPTYQYITNSSQSSLIITVTTSNAAANSYGVHRYVMIYNDRSSATTVQFYDPLNKGVVGPADSVSIPAYSYMEFSIIHPASNAKCMVTWSMPLKDIITM